MPVHLQREVILAYCIQMLSYLQQLLVGHHVRVAMRMARSHPFPPFYLGKKAERHETKGLQSGIFIHSEIGEGN